MAIGDTDRAGQWLEYYKSGGVIRSRWRAAPAPKAGSNYRRYKNGWLRIDSGGGSGGSGGSGGASSGSGGSKPRSSGSSKAPAKRRPPYWSKERFFNARTNKWDTRWRYRATNAEIEARQDGFKKDAKGFFKMQNGRKVYKTGRVGDRRFHYEQVDGKRTRIWDDPSRWPHEVRKKRQTLTKRRQALQNKLGSLRKQYSEARSDQHVLRRNISRRIKQLEADLSRTKNALKRLPSNNPFTLDVTKHEPKYMGGVLVALDFATEPDDKSPLSFSPKLKVGRNAKIFVRATIHLGDRDWRPGMLGAPDALRVKWGYPRGWLRLDRLPRVTDEYMASNPLYITRVFRSPGTGFRTPKFECQVFTYEFLPVYDGQAETHVEDRR